LSGQQPTVFVVLHDDVLKQKVMGLIESTRVRVRSYPEPTGFLRDRDTSDAGCVLLGVDLPHLTGVEVLGTLRERVDRIPAFFLAGRCDVPTAVAAMRQGAFDFLLMPVSDDCLLACIDMGFALDQQQRDAAVRKAVAARRLLELSGTERQVLDLVLRGASNRAIAAELGVSTQAADFHRHTMMRRVGANSLAELVRLCLLADLPDLGQPRRALQSSQG
jgi:FixJ family two-component response regulator